MDNILKIKTGDMLEIIESSFLYDTKGKYTPLMFIGKGGIGKSAGVRGIIPSLSEKVGCKVGYKDIRLTNFDATDLKGVPIPNIEDRTTIWLTNECFPDADRDGERGILVLDEITSANEQTQTAIYQLLAERELNGYKFPEGWMIVALGNGEEDGGTFNAMTANFGNRCQIYAVDCDKEDWLLWAREHDIHELVLAYISWENSVLHGYDPQKFGIDGAIFPSPRTYAMVSEILKYPIISKDPNDPLPKVVSNKILGTIGVYEGNKLLAFIDSRKNLIDVNAILKGKAKGAETYSLDELDKYMAMTIEGLLIKFNNLLKDYISKPVGERTKLANEIEVGLRNTVTWLSKIDVREYLIRFLSALLTGSIKLGAEPTDFVTTIFMDLSSSEDTSGFAEILSELELFG